MEAIATTYLEADAASITFSGITGTYEHLQLAGNARCTGTGTALFNWQIEFNGSAGTAYSAHSMQFYDTSIYAKRSTGTAFVTLNSQASGDGIQSTDYGLFIIDILDYANTNKNTTCQTTSGAALTQDAGTVRIAFGSGLWDNTAAVTQIKLTPSSGSMQRGSEFTLYGLKSS
jgi:hypothetical protein